MNDFFENENSFNFASGFEKQLLRHQITISDEAGLEKLEKATSGTTIIILVFSNRTGSNLIVDMIAGCGLHKVTDWEPLTTTVIIKRFKNAQFTSLADYLAWYITRSTANGHCVLKMSWSSLFSLSLKDISMPLFKNAKFILSERKNKMAQAVSYYIAQNRRVFLERKNDTDQQHRDTDDLLQLLNHPNLVPEIAKLLHDLYLMNSRNRYFLDLFSFSFLEIEYSDLVGNMESAKAKILAHLGFPQSYILASPLYNPSIKKQSNLVYDELERRVRQYFFSSFQS